MALHTRRPVKAAAHMVKYRLNRYYCTHTKPKWEKRKYEKEVVGGHSAILSPGLSHLDPHHGNHTGTKTDKECEQHEQVAVMIVRVISK